MEDEKHGTNAGYVRHLYWGETPCAECVAGKAKYDKKIRERPENKRRIRARSKAQHRAVQALTNKYRSLYNDVYKNSTGSPSERQRKARGEIRDQHRSEYRELYEAFRREEYVIAEIEEDI